MVILVLALTLAIIQCSINIIACLIYIYDSYQLNKKTREALDIVDLSIAIFFTFEMISNFYFHPKPKYRYFMVIDTYVDFLTVFPEYLSWAFSATGGFNVSFLRILRVFKIIRILKFQKTIRKVNLKNDNQQDASMPNSDISRLKRQLILSIVSLLAMFFIAAGFVLFLDGLGENAYNVTALTFGDSFYFVTISMVSVGYGDILPTTTLTRLSAVVMIV